MHRLHALTLVSALLIGLSSFSPVVAAADVSPIHVARHGEHARMIKRYALVERQGGLGGIFPGDDEDDGPSGSASATASSTSSSSTRSGILDGIPGIGGQTPTASSSSTPSATPTRSSSTSATRSSTTRPPVESTSSTATSATARPTITVTSWEDATPEQKQQIEENREHQSTLSRIPPEVRTGLIAAAAVIGGLAIIWTAIRKWKLRSSRSFKDRLAPIEWEKNDEKADTLPPPAMGDASDTASVRRNLFGAENHSNQSSLAPPAHDFTAGPGGFPYTRTPSPGPLRTASPGQFRTASPAQFRTASPAPMGAQGYNNNSDHGHGGYEQPRYGY